MVAGCTRSMSSATWSDGGSWNHWPTANRPSGAIAAVIQREFTISQPAVSQHLRVLRDSGFATVRADGARRLYAVDAEPLQEVDVWLDQFRRF